MKKLGIETSKNIVIGSGITSVGGTVGYILLSRNLNLNGDFYFGP